MASESKRTRQLDRELRALNCMVLPIVGGAMQPAGWPDRFIAAPGWNGFLEFKAESGRLSKLQRATIQDLRSLGIAAYVVRHVGHKLVLEDEDGMEICCCANARSLLLSLQVESSRSENNEKAQ